jgi:benzil reductase ((S)-benzoin forming)
MKKNEILFIVTGTTKGLGYDIFMALSEQEQNILTINRSPFDYENNISFDFSEIDELESMLLANLKEKIQAYQTVVMILNAALVDPVKKVGNYESADVIRIVNTNVLSPILLSNFLVKENKKGVIAHVSSGGIKLNLEGLGLYTSTKIATHKFCDIANAENTQLHFLNFDPGTMNTQMTEKLRDDTNDFQQQSREYLCQKLKEETYKPTKESAKELLDLIAETMNNE